MEDDRQSQTAMSRNECPHCGMVMVHSFDEYGWYSECTSCAFVQSSLPTYEQVIAREEHNRRSGDDWREDWIDDDWSDDDSTPWSHMFVGRESPALQFRREIAPHIPLVWQKGGQLSEVAQDAIRSSAKYYLDICYDIVESRQMYRALIDLGFYQFVKRYTGRDYQWIVNQCNNFSTRKPCEKCGCPVYFLPENEPRYILCENCRQLLPTLHELKTMPYVDYLRSDHWKRTRKDALERVNYRCQLCNKEGSLHVHHRTYERRGEERPEDLTVLCADCHKMFHDNRRLQS